MDQKMEMRSYQSDMLKCSLKNNTIIYLPTGSGKTFIAIQVIKRLQKDTQKKYSQGGKRIFFLVNSVALVEQQVRCVSTLTSLTVRGYSSEDKVDFWKLLQWVEELDAAQVLVMTSQILLDMLLHDYIKLSDIKLLIFDECHHAVNIHPMRRIMQYFDNKPLEETPKVLGLTATLLNRNIKPNQVVEEINKLETTFRSKISTTSSLTEVLSYSTNPNEIPLTYQPCPMTSGVFIAEEILSRLKSIVVSAIIAQNQSPNHHVPNSVKLEDDVLKFNKKVRNIIIIILNHLLELGPYGGALSILANITMMERHKLRASCPQKYKLVNIVICFMSMARASLESYMQGSHSYDKIYKNSSPKIQILLDKLKEYAPQIIAGQTFYKYQQPLSALIFVRERFTAKVLSVLLKHAKANCDDLAFLNVDYAIGYNMNPFSDTREGMFEKKRNKLVINKFTVGKLNCIICTEVMEEGIDIPCCNLVLRFDEISNFRSYIQSKGRGRHKKASFVMLVPSADLSKFKANYAVFQSLEKAMYDLLVGKTEERELPSNIAISKYPESCPPYIYKNASVTIDSAMSLLHRYCSGLSGDMFTVLMPEWFRDKTNNSTNGFCMSLYLPTLCPIKEIIKGNRMASLKLAKKSVALNACIKLHQAGELSDNLLPIDRSEIPYDPEIEKMLFSHWTEDSTRANGDLAKAGLKSNQRTYNKRLPACLQGEKSSFPVKYYIHLIEIHIKSETDDSQTKIIYDMLKSNKGYAIMTTKKLLDISMFSLFLTSGEVVIDIKTNHVQISFTEKQMEVIKAFHLMVFSDVLGIQKMFTCFDTSYGDNHFFIAPVHMLGTTICIDWDCLTRYTDIEPLEEPSIVNRRNIDVSEESYLGAVVVPWYRAGISNTRYIVTEVSPSMTPFSPFTTTAYSTFADYFKQKYDLNIEGPRDQPLLQVRYISGRMNGLLPRAISLATAGLSKSKYKKQFVEDVPIFDEQLIPELCVKFSFPGVLWLKATMMPSILHRLQMLLQAEELRRTIALETGLGCLILPEGTRWDSLTMDDFAALKSQEAENKGPRCKKDITPHNLPLESIKHTSPADISREGNYQLSENKLNALFPWPVEAEPIDVDRNFDTVTLIDIECFTEFVEHKIEAPISPVREMPTMDTLAVKSKKAICPPPYKQNDAIALLSKKPDAIGPQLVKILEALTTSKSNDIINYERLETLGDSFLKISASLYVWEKFPNLDEGRLTHIKGRMISNRNLYFCGSKIDLPGRMKIDKFAPKTDWVLPAFGVPTILKSLLIEAEICPSILYSINISRAEMLSGNISTDTLESIQEKLCTWINTDTLDQPANGMEMFLGRQIIHDKAVADCVEALIGAYLLHGGIEAGSRILQFLKIIPENNGATKLLNQTVATQFSMGKVSLENISFLLDHCQDQVEEILGYNFNDPCYLLQALSHSSNTRNRVTDSYERLEFIGDAILDFLVTSHIYENCGMLSPGDLTDLRSALVNNNTFACMVVRLNLHKYIQSSNSHLDNAILRFAIHQMERDHVIDEAVLYLLEEEACNLAEYVEVPKILGDIFESLAGAIFLDSGNDLAVVWKVFYKFMREEIALFSMKIPKQPVRLLYEKVHATPLFHPIVNINNSKIMIPLQVNVGGKPLIVHGFGNNKTLAKCSAAKIALRMLGQI